MHFYFIKKKLKWDINELESGSIVSFLNPYSYMLNRNKNLLGEIDYYGIDGILLVILFRCAFKMKINRRAFDTTSIAPILYKHAIAKNESIYFVGSTEENIKLFIRTLKKEYSMLNIAGFRDGFFIDKKDKYTEIDKIIRNNPNFVVVGMGSPLQEEFIVTLKNKGYKGISFTCGGYIHQSTENIKNFPDIINRLHLRWIYRIYKEPKMFKRYFLEYPKALYYLTIDGFKK